MRHPATIVAGFTTNDVGRLPGAPARAMLIRVCHLRFLGLWLLAACAPTSSGGDGSTGSSGSAASGVVSSEATLTDGAMSTGDTDEALPEPLGDLPGFEEVFLVPSAMAAVVADFDANGSLDIFSQDILMVQGQTTQIRGTSLLGNGLGEFPGVGPTLQANYGEHVWALDIVAGRFTVGDALPDLLAIRTAAIGAGDGAGGFTVPGASGGFGDVRLAFDFDNDGDDDIITGNSPRIYFNEGTGFVAGPGFIGLACYHIGFAAIDLDGDPWRDIAVVDSCNALPKAHPIAVYRNLGGKDVELVWQSTAGARGTELLIAADLTGDGLEDLVRPHEAGLLVFPSRGDGTFDAIETFAVPSEFYPHYLLPLRIDTDAHADLVLGVGYDLILIDGATRTIQTILAKRNVLAAADFNGDGRDDLVVQRMEGPFALGVWLSRP